MYYLPPKLLAGLLKLRGDNLWKFIWSSGPGLCEPPLGNESVPKEGPLFPKLPKP